MKKSTVNSLLLLLVLALAPLVSQAQPSPNPPGQISYQGFLTDASGMPLATNAPRNYTVIFRIYDASTAGNEQWAEQQVVTVDRGYFTVMLGNGNSIDSNFTNNLTGVFSGPSASDRYLGMTVNELSPNNEIAPRLRLLASPYAFLAQNAVKLVSSSGGDLITSSGTAVTVNGAVTASNFVGFGTIPIGGIIMWSGTSAPTGWALCDGNNGTPDLRGRFVLGSGSGTGLTPRTPGDTGGSETHTNTVAEMASHSHTVNDPGHTHTFMAHGSDGTGFNYGAIQTSDRGVNRPAESGEINTANTGITLSSNGLGQRYINMPPYYVLAYIMRVQ